jgi:hypothetical protein
VNRLTNDTIEQRCYSSLKEIVLLPKPEVGQIVRLDTYEGKLIITAVSEDGSTVDLASAANPNHSLKGVPCQQLLPAEGVDVG